MVSGIGSKSDAQALLQQLQQQRTQQLFQKTDADSNGLLSLDEFKAGAPKGASSGANAPSLEDVFSKIDSNSDGSVSQDELTADVASRGGGQPPAGRLSGQTSFDLTKLFESTDTDSNGSLSLDEFKAGAPKGASDIEALFGEADVDGDEALSEDELSAAVAKKGPPPGPPPGGGAPPSGGAESSSASAEWLAELLETDDSENLFDYLDQDDDDSVSEEELAQGFEAIRSEMLNVLFSEQGQGGSSGLFG